MTKKVTSEWLAEELKMPTHRYSNPLFYYQFEGIIGLLVDYFIGPREINIDKELLRAFSFFVATRKTFPFNESYLAGQLDEFEKRIIDARLYIDYLLKHFNTLLDSIPLENFSDCSIVYNSVICFYLHNEPNKEPEWRAELKMEHLSNIGNLTPRNIIIEILKVVDSDSKLKSVCTFTITSIERNIQQIQKILQNSHD